MDLWELANNQEMSKVTEKNKETTIIVIGDSKVGKTSFLKILK